VGDGAAEWELTAAFRLAPGRRPQGRVNGFAAAMVLNTRGVIYPLFERGSMNRSLIPALAVLAAVACAESAPEPVSPTEWAGSTAAVAGWTAAEMTMGLPIDEARRLELTAALDELRAAVLEVHRQHEAAGTLAGDERAAFLAGLHADTESLHERHQGLLASLDPVVAEELLSRVHEKMRAHHEETRGQHEAVDKGSLHERMRRLHGAGHQRAPRGSD
jgi:hypothetical protein